MVSSELSTSDATRLDGYTCSGYPADSLAFADDQTQTSYQTMTHFDAERGTVRNPTTSSLGAVSGP
jgi:hypothetical protein